LYGAVQHTDFGDVHIQPRSRLGPDIAENLDHVFDFELVLS
jgi:hypothetical protein